MCRLSQGSSNHKIHFRSFFVFFVVLKQNIKVSTIFGQKYPTKVEGILDVVTTYSFVLLIVTNDAINKERTPLVKYFLFFIDQRSAFIESIEDITKIETIVS